MRLGGVEIAVESIALAVTDDALTELRGSLTEEELAKAARLVSPVKQRRAIAARGSLRRALGRRLDLPAHRVQLARENDGKPVLSGAQQGALHFNLSHSGDIAVLAVTEAAPVGIDIEPLREMNLGIADAIFGPSERAAFAACDVAVQSRALLARWTMKEAALKAIGCGFQRSAMTLDMGPFESDRPITVTAGIDGKRDLTVCSFQGLQPGHVVALAVLQ